MLYKHCEIKWFHLQCVSLDVAPKDDWFCLWPSEVQPKEDVVIIDKVEPGKKRICCFWTLTH